MPNPTTLLFDFSRVLLFSNDPSYVGELNNLNATLSAIGPYTFDDYFQFDDELLRLIAEWGKRF